MRIASFLFWLLILAAIHGCTTTSPATTQASVKEEIPEIFAKTAKRPYEWEIADIMPVGDAFLMKVRPVGGDWVSGDIVNRRELARIMQAYQVVSSKELAGKRFFAESQHLDYGTDAVRDIVAHAESASAKSGGDR